MNQQHPIFNSAQKQILRSIPTNHIIVDKRDNSIWYEGIDDADCRSMLRPRFMEYVNKHKTFEGFPLRHIQVTNQEMEWRRLGVNHDKWTI